LCIDYRTLNRYIARTNNPIPVIEDQINILKDKSYFSILDLKDGFFHIRVAEESVKYTAFITPLGQFEYIKMSFGLKSAPGRFQKFVNEVLKELIRSGDVIVYIDGFFNRDKIVRTSFNRIEKKVFKLLVENKLNLRIDKRKFMFTEIEYLGYLVTLEDIRLTSDVKAVSNFPIPQSVKSVQSFLGLCSYFRKFIEGFSDH